MASGNDIKTAKATYEGFIKAATWGTVVAALATIFVVGLLVS